MFVLWSNSCVTVRGTCDRIENFTGHVLYPLPGTPPSKLNEDAVIYFYDGTCLFGLEEITVVNIRTPTPRRKPSSRHTNVVIG